MHGKQQYGEASRSSRNTTFARAANTKRSTRSFVLKWTELDGWSRTYDVEQIAREIKTDDWALFLRVLDETKAFAEAVNVARE
jgi:ParB family transcriptional regulator, chromosome partitioning protein